MMGFSPSHNLETVIMRTALLTILGLVACSTDMPLQAQRPTHSQVRRVSSSPLVVPVTGYVIDTLGLTNFAGTITIDSLSRNEASDSLFTEGPLEGRVTASNGQVTEVSVPVTHLYVEIAPQSFGTCNRFFFHFGDVALDGFEGGIKGIRSDRGVLVAEVTGDNAMGRYLCQLASAISSHDANKADRALQSVNASLGG